MGNHSLSGMGTRSLVPGRLPLVGGLLPPPPPPPPPLPAPALSPIALRRIDNVPLVGGRLPPGSRIVDPPLVDGRLESPPPPLVFPPPGPFRMALGGAGPRGVRDRINDGLGLEGDTAALTRSLAALNIFARPAFGDVVALPEVPGRIWEEGDRGVCGVWGVCGERGVC